MLLAVCSCLKARQETEHFEGLLRVKKRGDLQIAMKDGNAKAEWSVSGIRPPPITGATNKLQT